MHILALAQTRKLYSAMQCNALSNLPKCTKIHTYNTQELNAMQSNEVKDGICRMLYAFIYYLILFALFLSRTQSVRPNMILYNRHVNVYSMHFVCMIYDRFLSVHFSGFKTKRKNNKMLLLLLVVIKLV